jgi:hypothetical protein
MKLLLFSLVIYLLGVAAVLYLRPQLMFRRDGSWKEFGVGGEDTSVFPIWTFCIVWALLSYALGRFLFTEQTVAETAAVLPLMAEGAVKSLSYTKPETSGAVTQPGYYRLDASVMRKKGVPRYIYVGEETPDDLETTA